MMARCSGWLGSSRDLCLAAIFAGALDVPGELPWERNLRRMSSYSEQNVHVWVRTNDQLVEADIV